MRASAPSPRSNHLLWLVLQLWVLLPAAWGGASEARSSWPAGAAASALVALVLVCASVNLVRLVRTPGRPTKRSTVVLGLVGALTLALGLPALTDGLPWHELAVGLTLVGFGLVLLALAVREGRRTAAGARVPA